MLNGAKISKVAVSWTAIIYVACVILVLIFPRSASFSLKWLIHAEVAVPISRDIQIVPVIGGLILWIILAYLGARLYVWLYNKLN